MRSRSYMPNKPGFVERHPWRCLLIAWLVGMPLRFFATSLEVWILPDVIFTVGVLLLIVGQVRRARRARRSPK